MPDVRRQQGAASASCARLQPWQLPAHAGDAGTDQGLVVISHGRTIAFQMAEVAIPRHMFQEILQLIAELRPTPPPAPA